MTSLSESEFDDWDAFAENNETATLFHTTWWHQAWDAKPVIHARRNKGGKIESGVLFSVRNTVFARMMERPPLTPFNGPVFTRCEQSLGEYRRNSIVKQEISSSIESLPKLNLYDFILDHRYADITPFLTRGFHTYSNYTYVIPRESAKIVPSNMSPHHLTNLKKARKEMAEHGYAMEIDPPIEPVLSLLLTTAAYKKFPLSTRIPAWWRIVKGRGAGRCYCLRDARGEALCTTIMVWDSRTAYYLLGGMLDPVRRTSRLNYLLFERMILDAHAMGLDFDFEGSHLPGVERFFRGWGGELRLLHRVVKCSSLFRYVFARKYMLVR